MQTENSRELSTNFVAWIIQIIPGHLCFSEYHDSINIVGTFWDLGLLADALLRRRWGFIMNLMKPWWTWHRRLIVTYEKWTPLWLLAGSLHQMIGWYAGPTGRTSNVEAVQAGARCRNRKIVLQLSWNSCLSLGQCVVYELYHASGDIWMNIVSHPWKELTENEPDIRWIPFSSSSQQYETHPSVGNTISRLCRALFLL